MRHLKGYFFILSATIFWGISATVAKFLFTHQVDTLILVQMRMSLSCIVLFILLFAFRRDVLRIHLADLIPFAMLGILGTAACNYTYYAAIRATNVATAILLQYMAPLLVMAYAAAAKQESMTFAKLGAAGLSLFGCYLAVGGFGPAVITINPEGLFYGIAAACTWAFSNVMLKRLLDRYTVWTVTVYGFLCATIFWLFINPPWKIVAAGYSADDWRTFFIFAMVSILIPHSLYFVGAQYLTATRTIITATFEPVVAIVSAYLFLGEGLTPLRIVGAVLVIAAIVLLQYREEATVAAELRDSIPLKEL